MGFIRMSGAFSGVGKIWRDLFMNPLFGVFLFSDWHLGNVSNLSGKGHEVLVFAGLTH